MAAIIGHGTWHKHGASKNIQMHEEHMFKLINICTFTLLVYATMLRFSEEVECIWRKRFSLITLFYILTRYGSLLMQGPSTGLKAHRIMSESRRFCNAFFHVTAFGYILVQVGIQGLLISRAYAVCRGSRFLAVILIFSFAVGLILLVLDILSPYKCNEVLSAHRHLIVLMFGISDIFTNVLVFGICTWSLWGTWKLKRQAGIGRRNDLVSIVFKQNIKFCLVMVFTIAAISVRVKSNFLAVILGRIQINILTIMIPDFTLDLRQRNCTAIDELTSNRLSLSSLQYQSMLQSVHQSILVEMGTLEDIDAEEGDNGEDDGVINSESAHVGEPNALEQTTPAAGGEIAC